MRVIGLTGGIGSGKSTAARYFSELSIPVIDADLIARELVEKNANVIKMITDHFNLKSSESIDRAALRDIVFTQPNERNWLESLLHPLIVTEINRQLRQVKSVYCILVIPLLLEKKTKLKIKIDRILVIDLPESLQIQRIKQREFINKQQLQVILNLQMKREERLHQADDVIDNSGNFEALKKQVHRFHHYMMMNN